jgi:hypothetical protein
MIARLETDSFAHRRGLPALMGALQWIRSNALATAQNGTLHRS